ncbi:MAG: glycoside hydrolase family 16 protein [Candidatus Hydrogenedentes bacterium]|jgi:beta-glucanase (GH16 family)|nr:glycoside hydrolase family 16 protein [Candidatus Hydrogenedentota bacterium]
MQICPKKQSIAFLLHAAWRAVLSAAALTMIFSCFACHLEKAPKTIDPETEPGWSLWMDESFDGQQVDETRWDTGFPWGRCWPPLYYTKTGNIEINEGILQLIARSEVVTGFCFDWDEAGNFTPYYADFPYTSGMFYSRQAFRYGYFECRFKVPRGKSFNAAFWLYGEEDSEIDVFEILGSNPADAQMTLHWKNRDPLVGTRQWPKHIVCNTPSFAEGWHTFGLLWEPNRLEWYLDGKRVEQSLWTRFIRGRHIPTVDMHLILTLAIGVMDGYPDETTPFPSAFEVDRVRVFHTPESILPS